jgi:hypothetical protein
MCCGGNFGYHPTRSSSVPKPFCAGDCHEQSFTASHALWEWYFSLCLLTLCGLAQMQSSAAPRSGQERNTTMNNQERNTIRKNLGAVVVLAALGVALAFALACRHCGPWSRRPRTAEARSSIRRTTPPTTPGCSRTGTSPPRCCPTECRR